jgi:uncharacterized protein
MSVLIAIGGLSGSGKSTLARALAAERGSACYRSDVERKRLFGVAETERLGPEGYTPQATTDVYRLLGERAAVATAGGQSVVIDAVFQRPSEREAIAKVALQAGANFVGFWLDVAHALRRDRVALRTRDASDATPEIVDAQAARDCGDITWHKIDASGGPEHVLASARRILGAVIAAH